MNILEEANKIVNATSEEKEPISPFNESMERAAQIFNGMTGLNITAIEMYKASIALKLSSESYNHKEDNLLDSCVYLGALNNYVWEKQEKEKEFVKHHLEKMGANSVIKITPEYLRKIQTTPLKNKLWEITVLIITKLY